MLTCSLRLALVSDTIIFETTNAAISAEKSVMINIQKSLYEVPIINRWPYEHCRLLPACVRVRHARMPHNAIEKGMADVAMVLRPLERVLCCPGARGVHDRFHFRHDVSDRQPPLVGNRGGQLGG